MRKQKKLFDQLTENNPQLVEKSKDRKHHAAMAWREL